MSTFHCTSCGKAIFHSDAVLRRVTLSRFGDHDADCFAIRDAIAPETLRRYDVSLHEGWYCCRFIMMRMLVDKFRTGSDLLVYADAVVEVAEGARPPTPASVGPVVKLTEADHDDVLGSADVRDKLVVVKHGAIWCPPCRHMDTIIARMVARNALQDVVFFELDIDEEHAIAQRFPIGSIPYFVFYYNGVQVPAGVCVGAMTERQLATICASLLDRARTREYREMGDFHRDQENRGARPAPGPHR